MNILVPDAVAVPVQSQDKPWISCAVLGNTHHSSAKGFDSSI